jgi:hypothetical protein
MIISIFFGIYAQTSAMITCGNDFNKYSNNSNVKFMNRGNNAADTYTQKDITSTFSSIYNIELIKSVTIPKIET